jgi:predicted SnoaL-like aldol condensation-catalyzing enzyme
MNSSSTAAANKALVSQVMDAVFVRRDSSVVERHFAKDYVQHNPSFPNGRDAIPGLIGQLAAGFRYEAGMIVAEGDLVMMTASCKNTGMFCKRKSPLPPLPVVIRCSRSLDARFRTSEVLPR